MIVPDFVLSPAFTAEVRAALMLAGSLPPDPPPAPRASMEMQFLDALAAKVEAEILGIAHVVYCLKCGKKLAKDDTTHAAICPGFPKS